MQYAVDAKIEKGQPRLRVLDAETGKVHMEWSLTRINEMLDQGEIEEKDFLHPERYGMNLLLKNLFLLSCIERMNTGNYEAMETCAGTKNIIPIENIGKQIPTHRTQWHFGIKANPV